MIQNYKENKKMVTEARLGLTPESRNVMFFLDTWGSSKILHSMYM